MRSLILLSATCFVSVYTAKLPSFMKACSISSPTLDQCIEAAIESGGSLLARGIPDLGIPSIDPVTLNPIYINTPSLNVNLTEPVLTGLADFELISVHINSDRSKLYLNFTANVTVKAHYVMDGQVLILPIKGDGDARIKLKNMNTAIKFDLKLVDKYWTIPTYKKSFTVENANFKFTNLFNGNKELDSSKNVIESKRTTINSIQTGLDRDRGHISLNCGWTLKKNRCFFDAMHQIVTSMLIAMLSIHLLFFAIIWKADITLKFVNENWKEIVDEIASPAIHEGIAHCVENIKMLVSAVPAAELLLE